MNWLFSNRNLLRKLLVTIFLLMAICVYTHIVGNKDVHTKLIALEQCLGAPVSCVGNPLVMRVRIVRSSGKSFIAYPRIRGVYQLEHSVPLSGDLTGIRHGDVIDILGNYSLDSTFSIKKYQRNNWIRPAKYAVSTLGLLLTVVLFSRRYRFSSNQFFPLVRR